MPPDAPPPSPALYALGFFMLAFLAGSLTAWGWMVVRLARKRPLLDDSMPRSVPWGALAVVGVCLLYVATQFTVGSLYFLIRGRDAEPAKVAEATAAVTAPITDDHSSIPAEDQLFLSLAVNLGIVVMVPILLRRTSGARAADFGLVAPNFLVRDFARGFVGFLILTPLVMLTHLLALKIWSPNQHPVFEVIETGLGVPRTGLVLLTAVVAAPLAEELLFRGVLLGWLTRLARESESPPGPIDATGSPTVQETWNPVDSRQIRDSLTQPESAGHRKPSPWIAPVSQADQFNPQTPPGRTRLSPRQWAANIAVSAIFAGMHYAQWPTPVPIFVLSLGLGWLYQSTGRLGGPVVLHAVFNGFNTGILLLASAAGVVPVSEQTEDTAVVPSVSAPETAEDEVPAADDLTDSAADLGFSRPPGGPVVGTLVDSRGRFEIRAVVGSVGPNATDLDRGSPWTRRVQPTSATS